MDIILRKSSREPIYEQIVSQLREQILSGALKGGDALPSIRALAKDLKISVITTKRAYDELEAAGLVYTVAGKGCFVAEKNLELIREHRTQELEEHLKSAAAIAKSCGVTWDEILEALRLFWEEDDEQ